MKQTTPLMSIGALSKATGVPADTLRTWERRYGFPAAERTDTGHRRYSVDTLARLRLALRAIEHGHRPGDVLSADEAALQALLQQSARVQAPTVAIARPASPVDDENVARWLGHVERYEGRALERELNTAAALAGGLDFLEHQVAPFLRELGRRWARGDIDVGREHFASERLRECLAQRWRPLSDAATGPLMICATLGGERHVLGLHMAALALALHNARIVFLGAEAPPSDIARAVVHHAAEAVVLSAAEGAARANLARDLETLQTLLPADVPILTGGAGFRPAFAGVVAVEDLAGLVAWLETRSAPTARPSPRLD